MEVVKSVEVVPGWPEPPDDSVAGTPARRPGSVRRTATINMVWPDGSGTPLQLRGRARDLLTPTEGSPGILAEAGILVQVGEARTVTSIEAWPAEPARLELLVGARGGGAFRSAIDEALPGERQAATPLYFLLDDIAGASLIAGFAWSRRRPGWGRVLTASPPAPSEPIGIRKGRLICSGLRPGGYHIRAREEGNSTPHFLRRAGDLSSADPWAWHEIEPAAEVCMRRRRRVDVWDEGGEIRVDAHFRDSLWDVDGTELALHEYSLGATVDRASGRILSLAATPRVLPFPECPGAAPHVAQLVGMPVGGFRTSVQETLRELQACTHLNDMLRCLSEVHALSQFLEAPLGARS